MSNKVAILMGSTSDWPAIKPATEILDSLKISYEVKVLSAHRTPKQLLEYIEEKVKEGSIKVFIAGAGGAAHLAGVISAHTVLPVLGVPMESQSLKGLDSLLSTVQMPSGIPVATFGIGSAGSSNAALFAAAILGIDDESVSSAIKKYRDKKAKSVLDSKLD
ncbi:MAG: 5-(carboxyamino)imidazole ribonucleotide mutase [Dehalococcoidia bacterium]|nr:5-(carboxyamino)imidazole ribonucleotide mutase [Dehalococcoidia bacterium]MEC7921065.1 5-(carboxyamino)imidazole ribonucleotide mutase [Chloroflexota bacterium]MEC9451795.1 5-(carboxyamino)imidazole ribonucleotide mutase [Chloroflexota bacterium]MQG04509.1 5-(carboxyamino)imidazole ribonucleotide mutase [SAR202 cluster bacterium]|tara:strand:- start:538 stop:1023 length:486 start_codon:yes stop_codon:yes gene_type:complete